MQDREELYRYAWGDVPAGPKQPDLVCRSEPDTSALPWLLQRPQSLPVSPARCPELS